MSSRSRRWACILVLLLPVALAANWRFRSYLLTRRIQAVLTGLEQVRLDKSTEEQVLRMVPGLIWSGGEHKDGSSRVRVYWTEISNENEWSWWMWNIPLQFRGPTDAYEKWNFDALSYSLKVAYWLGWRYISFHASLSVRDGIASKIEYDLDRDVQIGMPRASVLEARSFHAILRWEEFSNADDERPGYRIKGSERGLTIAYAADAPPEVGMQALRLNMSCYYLSIFGCEGRNLAPLVWRDMQSVEGRAISRLRDEKTSCPDWLLAGRARYLPLSAELLEVVRRGRDSSPRYELKEVIRGLSWDEQSRRSSGSNNPRPEPPPSLHVGDRVLFFSGAFFNSCQIVPASASAIAEILAVVGPSIRSEDNRSFIESKR